MNKEKLLGTNNYQEQKYVRNKQLRVMSTNLIELISLYGFN